MNYFRVIGLFLATTAIWAVGLISFTGCTGSAGSTLVAPEFEEPEAPPVEVTVDQLYAEYMADEAAADAKYKGERLLFYEVEVEQVVGKDLQMAEALGASGLDFVKLYFTTGFVKFKLRGEDFGIMQNIEEGYVLNIVGECRGLQKGFIAIENCWVESVIGDIGTSELPYFY